MTAIAVAVSLLLAATVVSRRGDESSPRPAASPPAVAASTPAESEPHPSPTPPEDPQSIGIWPITTNEELSLWHQDETEYPFLRDMDATALQFGRQYLHVPDAYLRQQPPPDGIHNTGVADEPTLCRMPRGSRREICFSELRFSLVGDVTFVDRVLSPALTITSPAAGSTENTTQGQWVRTPLVVTGTVQNKLPVDVVIRTAPTRGGRDIAHARATTSPDGRTWRATLPFATIAFTGSVLASTTDPHDGRITAAAAEPLTFDLRTPEDRPATASPSATTTTAAPTRFVAVEGGRIGLYETQSGRRLRYLTEPIRGGVASNLSVSPDGSSVLYVYGDGECRSEIRQVPVAGGRPRTVVVRVDGWTLRGPELSSRGRLAYVARPCRGGTDRLVIRDLRQPGHTERTVEAGPDASLGALAWAGDGSVLAAVLSEHVDSDYIGTVRLVRSDTTRVSDEAPATWPGENSCGWSNVAYAGLRLLGAEVCGAGVLKQSRVVRIDSDVWRPGDTNDELTGFEARSIFDFSVTPAGDHVLVGLRYNGEPIDEIYRVAIGAEPVKIAEGLTSPAWVA